jgi:hypothetical protein
VVLEWLFLDELIARFRIPTNTSFMPMCGVYKLHHDGLLAATKPFSLTKRVIVSCADMRLRRNTTTKFRAEIFRLGKIQAAVFARHAEVTSMAGPTESPGMRLFIARVCRINSRH